MASLLSQGQNWFLILIAFVLLATKLFAFIMALTYRGEAYEAAGKLTKPAWLLILGLGLAVDLIFFGGVLQIVSLAFTVAAIVFIVDVRPALSSLRRR